MSEDPQSVKRAKWEPTVTAPSTRQTAHDALARAKQTIEQRSATNTTNTSVVKTEEKSVKVENPTTTIAPSASTLAARLLSTVGKGGVGKGKGKGAGGKGKGKGAAADVKLEDKWVDRDLAVRTKDKKRQLLIKGGAAATAMDEEGQVVSTSGFKWGIVLF